MIDHLRRTHTLPESCIFRRTRTLTEAEAFFAERRSFRPVKTLLASLALLDTAAVIASLATY